MASDRCTFVDVRDVAVCVGARGMRIHVPVEGYRRWVVRLDC